MQSPTIRWTKHGTRQGATRTETGVSPSCRFPPMGRLNDAEWWWEFGLDGIGGAIVGGLATVLALWLTLRHERRMADLAECRAVAADVHALAWQAMALVTFAASESADGAALQRRLSASMFRLAALTRPRWPMLATSIDSYLKQWIDDGPTLPGQEPSVRTTAKQVAGSVALWIEDPASWSNSWTARLARLVRRLRYRSSAALKALLGRRIDG